MSVKLEKTKHFFNYQLIWKPFYHWKRFFCRSKSFAKQNFLMKNNNKLLFSYVFPIWKVCYSSTSKTIDYLSIKQ